ncbi:hypothetical protein [Nocardioides caricicola]|uniref:DUF222 domain-containing protein n=1 Tax=Nocardioides caricicola TaxID=634770 RepID=A0ABW0MZK0_9ACTN
MTDTPEYRFLGERVRDALHAAEGTLLEEDSIEEWSDLVEDGSESAVLLTSQQIESLTMLLPYAAQPHDSQHGNWHADALAALRAHQDCHTVITDLIAERDDVLAGIVQARDYVFTDLYAGEYGDLYVSAEQVLDRLRPRLRERQSVRDLDVARSEWCSECLERWVHEDSCAVPQEKQDVTARRDGLIRSHLHCEAIGKAVIAHTARCLTAAETIAQYIALTTELVYGDRVVDPHDLLSVMEIADLDVRLDGSPEALAVSICPPLDDPDYCQEEPFHSSPHRACRSLT